jgi:hypothetical protein
VEAGGLRIVARSGCLLPNVRMDVICGGPLFLECRDAQLSPVWRQRLRFSVLM